MLWKATFNSQTESSTPSQLASRDFANTQTQSQFKAESFTEQMQNVIKKQERVLSRQAMVMSLSFFVCWGTYFSMVLVIIVSQKPMIRSIDAAISMGPIMNSALNPILLYLFDTRVRAGVKSLSSSKK
jgi:hypothetical protein